MANLFTKILYGLIALCGVSIFAAIGFVSEIPQVMVPLFALLVIIPSGIIIFRMSRNKRRSYEDIKSPEYLNLCSGLFLLLFAVVFPLLCISNFRGGFFSNSAIILFTILLTIIGSFGVWLVNVLGNKKMLFLVLGYLVLFACAIVPALVVSKIDASFGTLGVVYFTLMLQAIIVWSGFTLVFPKLKKIFKTE